MFEGKPAANAMVHFHPVDKSKPDVVAPQGQVGADGSFRLTTYRFGDGAPAGKYTVSVFWGQPSKGGDQYDRILVPARYLKPETSGLSAEVPTQATELQPFLLKR
jgi:hypothetical protein